jgi:hypothetical protein
VPPAFSDPTHAALGDLTLDVIQNHYADHGNLVDYVGGGAGTAYGARREADGRSRWDLEFDRVYFELGNELWGTPDGRWDLKVDSNPDNDFEELMQNSAVYYQRRMTEMKGRPGWRPNMRVGFGCRKAMTWVDPTWGYSYDKTVVPAVKDLADFFTISMYYGGGDSTNTDEEIYGGLFARAQWHEREIAEMRQHFANAAGRDLEACVYEGNAVWGPYSKHLDEFIYSKEVSVGQGVSLVDNYAAANRAGLRFNNHFHFNGNVWATVTSYPELYRKPAFLAIRMFTREIRGDMVTATVTGSPTWDDALTGETGVPYVACYPYKDGPAYYVLLVNRHRTQAQTLTIKKTLAPTRLVKLTSAGINDNNEAGEQVRLETEALPGQTVSSYSVTVPPFSAYLMVSGDAGGPPTRTDIDAAVRDLRAGQASATEARVRAFVASYRQQ